MSNALLAEFFSEDGDVGVCRRLLDAIRKQKASGDQGIQEFQFNRFIVALDFEKSQAKLKDDLDTGPEGEYKINLQEFELALQERSLT